MKLTEKEAERLTLHNLRCSLIIYHHKRFGSDGFDGFLEMLQKELKKRQRYKTLLFYKQKQITIDQSIKLI